jgi:hypothetical protein
MNKVRSNKLNMYDSVGSFFVKFADRLAGYIVLIALKTEFIALVAQIKAKDAGVQTAPAGKTNAKIEAREVLINTILPLTKKLYVFAKKEGNEELKTICNMTRSDFWKLRDADLEIKVDMISKYLNEKKTNLAGYLVTQENITTLQTRIEAFKNSESEQDTGQSTKVAGHMTMTQLFDRADELLNDEMDALMAHYAETDRELYETYNAARVLKDYGNHSSKDDNDDGTEPPQNPGS